MRVTVTLKQGETVYVGEAELHAANGTLPVAAKAEDKVPAKRKTPTVVVAELYQSGFFIDSRTLADVRGQLEKAGIHYRDSAIAMALDRAKYLHKDAAVHPLKYVQKFPAT